MVKTVSAVSEHTYWALCCRGAGCLSGVRTYLLGTVLQRCRLFKQCQNLFAVHCVTVVKAVLAMLESACRALCYSGAVSEHTYWALCCRGAGCLSGVRTYLLGTVLQRCRLFKQCQNLFAVHCVTVVKAVLAMLESACQALCYSGEGYFSNVRTYLP